MKRIMLLLALCFLPLFGRAQSHEFSYPETWMQFTPVAFHLGAAELGLKCECSFSERAVRATLAYATQTGSRYNSFPSAHTAAAFTGAELVRSDYGNGPGSAFYACGVYVAAMRVQHRRHWWWDTVAGASIGVASVYIARALEEPVWELLESLGLKRGGESLSLAPTHDPASGAICATLAIRF